MLLSRIVNSLWGVRGMRLPLTPVTRGSAPVHREANPGAVLDGRTGMTLSAQVPPSISLARFGNLPCFTNSETKEETAPSHATTMARGAVWVCARAGKPHAFAAMIAMSVKKFLARLSLTEVVGTDNKKAMR